MASTSIPTSGQLQLRLGIAFALAVIPVGIILHRRRQRAEPAIAAA